MVDDKWIGLALAVSSSLAIGTSFIITKKVRGFGLEPCSGSSNISQGLNDAARHNSGYVQASEDRAYLRNPIWWAGMSTSKFSFYYCL
jgi:magnesium transporter